MSKSSKNKKTNSTKFSFVPLTLFLLIVVAMFLAGYFTAKSTLQPHSHEEGITVEMPEEHVHEEVFEDTSSATEENFPAEETAVLPAPDAEIVNTVQMGDNVWYTLYTDGTLLIMGSGSTWDFETPVDMLSYFAEQLCLKEIRVKKEWFYAVTDIVIDETITVLGKCALAMYANTESVNYGGTLKSVGENAFRNCGAWTDSKKDTFWNVDFTGTKIEDGAFNGCKNPPVETSEQP